MSDCKLKDTFEKKADKGRKIYYIYGLFLLLGAFFVFSFVEVLLINMMYFYVSFFWNFAIYVPGMERLVQKKRYRYSFLRAIFLLNRIFSNDKLLKLLPYSQFLGRLMIPVLFILLLIVLFNNGNILFAFAGTVYFELCLFAFGKSRYVKWIMDWWFLLAEVKFTEDIKII